MNSVTIENVEEMIERIPKPSGSSVIVTLPKTWSGKTVKVVLICDGRE